MANKTKIAVILKAEDTEGGYIEFDRITFDVGNPDNFDTDMLAKALKKFNGQILGYGDIICLELHDCTSDR